jgi:hypothetical protein
MVLQTSEKTAVPRIIKSFPSTELLDGLIQDYFAYQSHQLDPFIHAPTFYPNEESSDMLTALAASGAVRSAIPTIRKLGYALMEVARLQMSTKVFALCVLLLPMLMIGSMSQITASRATFGLRRHSQSSLTLVYGAAMVGGQK